MTRTLTTATLLALLTALGHPASLRGQPEPDLEQLALQYLALDSARQSEAATETDVDRVLARLTDDVVYEHPRAGARIQGKEALREGMLSFLGATRAARDSVINVVVGPGVAILTVLQSFEMRQDGHWEARQRRAVKVFEFQGELVRRVIDYW
jgi:ketosteroid isomerase-like protein